MTGKTFTKLVTIAIVMLAFVSPNFAQESQAGNGLQGNRQAALMAEAENLRNDLISVYAETEALIEFLAGYDFIRQSDAMKNYDAIRQKLSQTRQLIERMPADQLFAMSQDNSWMDKQFINRVTRLSQEIRSDAKLQEMIRKAGQYPEFGRKKRNLSLENKYGYSRGVIAAPAYIPPSCNYDDPSDYPSGVDLGIAHGISIALHLASDLAPSELEVACALVPNPIHIAFAIAAGITDQVLNALEAVAADAGYCEKIRFYIEDKIKDDRGITTILMNDDYYLTFMLKSVRAALSTASSAGVPINCGNARLTEATSYFDGSDNFNSANGANRVVAYRLLRAAYQNIGAASCVQ